MPEDLFAGLFDTDLTAVIGVGDFLLCLGCSLILGLVMGAGLIAGMGYLGCALLLEREVFPASTMELLTTACLFFGTASGGAAAAGRRGEKQLEAGAVCGLSLAAAVVIAALMAPGEGPVTAACLRFAIAAAAGGLFGGSLRLGRAKAKRRKNRLIHR